MADISGLGGSSSIELLVSQYRTSLSKPVVALETKQSALSDRIKALAELKAKLQTLFGTVKALALGGTESPFSAYAVSSSREKVATATATSSSAVGSHSLKVMHLAANDALLSSSVQRSASSGLSTGTDHGFSLTVGGVTQTVTVNFSSAANGDVLSAIAAAVNGNSALSEKVSASVVNVSGTEARLVLTSKASGSSNTITSVGGDFQAFLGLGGVDFNARSASTATGAGFVHSGDAAAALDARFILDGVEVTRESNTVNDVVEGLVISLKAKDAEADEPLTLQVTVDKEKIKTKLQEFITNYNAILSYLGTQTAIDTTAKTRGQFASDSSILNLRSSLRLFIGQAVPGIVSGNPTTLAEIGIGINRDGSLSLTDTSKFEKALSVDARKVSDLFTNGSGEGIADRLKTLLNSYVSTGGELENSTTRVNGQISAIKSRITRLNAQIDKRAEAFRDQFAQIQVLIAQASRQQQMMQSLGYL